MSVTLAQKEDESETHPVSGGRETPGVSLLQIWSAPIPFLKQALESVGRTFSNNLNRDKATVAIIYYNEGMLTPEDAYWVSQSQFVTAMSSTQSLEEGLEILRRPFVLLLLDLYGSFFEAVNDVWNISEDDPQIEITMMNIAGNVIRDAVALIIFYVVGETVMDTARRTTSEIVDMKAYNAASSIVKPPGTSLESIATAAADAAWRVIISQQPQIETGISQIEFTSRAFSPRDVVSYLLSIDLTRVIPIARCFYLHRIGQMLTMLAPYTQNSKETDLSAQFDAAVQKYGCGEVLAEVPATPFTGKGLSPLTSKIGPDEEAALRRLFGEYVGRPPTEEEVLQRLLALV